MDRQTPHDLGGASIPGSMREEAQQRREAQRRRYDVEAKRSNFVPTTRGARATPTGDGESGRFRSSSVEDLAQHDSFDDGPNRLIRRGGSWDEGSGDDEARRSPRERDMRKAMEATTPTLVDEVDYVGDEEHEMLHLERIRQRAFFGADTHLRRTPGAQMYKSNFEQQNVRRTPGASQMHRSAPANVIQRNPELGDTSALGFGLTLSTPVAASDRGKPIGLSSQAPSHSTAESPKVAAAPSGARPPTAPGSYNREQRGAFVAPWTLSENSHLDTRRGAYSPNTLRLTEDLGNLLLEDDEGADEPIIKGSEVVGGQRPEALAFGAAKTVDQEVSESWTAPYVIGMEASSGRVPRSSSGRGRRGKTDSHRRSRGSDRSNARQTPEQGYVAPTGGFLSNAQHPTPVRGGQGFGTFVGGHFGFDGSGHGNNAYPAESEEAAAAPRLLNFGGAFAPPSKVYGGGTFHRPVPSSADSNPVPGPMGQAADANAQSTFPTSTPAFGAAFHSPFQQAQHPFAQQPFAQQPFAQQPFVQQPFAQQPFGAHATRFQPQFGAPPTLFGGNPTISQSPTFNFPPQDLGYPMHAPGMHPGPQNFMPNMAAHHHHHQQSPLPFPPQVWPQPMPIQFGGGMPMDQANWPGSHGGWPMGEYGYGMQRANEPGGATMAVQNWRTETETKTEHIPPEMGTNPFSTLSQGEPQVSAAPQTARTSNRGKNQRKNATRKGTKSQSKNQGGQRLDSSNQSMTGKKLSTTSSKTKKKSSKDRSTPPVQNVKTQTTSNEERTETPADASAEAKRGELVESPAIRSAFKDFYRKFRAEEKVSAKGADLFAMQAVADGSLPESIHWKVYLELADLAKRTNKFAEARKLYRQVCQLQPFASQGWLEYSKLEEECGNMNFCTKILKAGLGYCEYSENLLTRAIKHEEKMGNLARARELLSRLKHVGIDKVWRTVLEGALLEARAGNDVMARRVLKYLMHHVPWYGPLYLEAYKLEKDLGRSKEALAIVERGLAAIPRYGPLWFGAFRLCEEIDMLQAAYQLPLSISMIQRATSNISKELIWKVHLEAAQMLERSAIENLNSQSDPTADAIMDLSRKRFAMTILTCPPNLRWKVWLAAGRMELAAGIPDRARNLFLRAHRVVPDKGRAVALLECARLEEFVGDTDLASAILCKSRSVSGSDWKVWLESVLLEIRYGNYERATELAQGALKQHSGTGRLWASLVQLRHFDQGEEAQFEALKFALNAVPKSGEVWCEGARIHLNPFSRSFDLVRARRHLYFATKFTPQYGDGFLESLRLEVLEQWLSPIAKTVWESTKQHFDLSEGTNYQDELVKYVYRIFKSIHSLNDEAVKTSSKEGLSQGSRIIFDEATSNIVLEGLQSKELDQTTEIVHLKIRCANADPNYGSLWFHCRTGPTDTSRNILSRSVDLMLEELTTHAEIYLASFLRRFAVLEAMGSDLNLKQDEVGGKEKTASEESGEFEKKLNNAYLSAPSLKDIILRGAAEASEETHMDLLESSMSESNFVTGLVALSKQKRMDQMSFHERRRALFGTDSLFS
jgi:tetratricopeptide (TPR) repeat protein